jgi:uncharacterized protein YuzE
MARRRPLSADANRLLMLATRRVKIPALPFRVEYDPEVDTLYIRFKDGVAPTHSKDDPDNGLVYDYRGRSLIGIEIPDASQD